MSEKLEKLMEELLAEQRKTSLYTLTLERDRLLGALMQAGLGLPTMFSNEFILVPGATQTIIQPIPAGFVGIGPMGSGSWNTSLPWWCSYSLWMDTTPPATPLDTGTRMPEYLASYDFAGIFPTRFFLLHTVTNNHVAQTAYCMVWNAFVLVSNETWDMIRAVFLDPIVADLRKRALEISGIER